ncbi:MAG: DMT family transporter [Bacteroidota bacterium]
MPKSRFYIALHFSVLLFGFAGLFGKWLSIPSELIVLGRTLFASLGIGIWFLVRPGDFTFPSRKHLLTFFLSGSLLAFHWLAFFKSIQLSSVAIGLLTFSSFPLFVILLAPFTTKETFSLKEVGVVILILIGTALLLPWDNLQGNLLWGIIWGLLAGFSFALLNIVNKGLVSTYTSLHITFYQCLIATIVLIPFSLGTQALPTGTQISLLVLLGILFTAVAHSLYIFSMKGLRTQLVSITACMEPVYGILAAFLLLGERPEWMVLAGGGLILLATLLASISFPTPAPASTSPDGK